MSVSIY